MNAALLICFLSALTCTLADPQWCPNPDAARHLVAEERVQVEAPQSGRESAEIDIAEEVLRDHEVSCAAVLNLGDDPAAAISFGRNREGGLGVRLTSGDRAPINTVLSVYTA